MTTKASSGERGLYATFAVTVIAVALLGAALFRPRDARPTHRDVPHGNAVLLDEPVGQP